MTLFRGCQRGTLRKQALHVHGVAGTVVDIMKALPLVLLLDSPLAWKASQSVKGRCTGEGAEKRDSAQRSDQRRTLCTEVTQEFGSDPETYCRHSGAGGVASLAT